MTETTYETDAFTAVREQDERKRPMASEETEPQTTKVTVKLTAKSVDALLRASREAGLNRTDTINRAVQLYDFVLNVLHEDPDNKLLLLRNGQTERIHLL